MVERTITGELFRYTRFDGWKDEKVTFVDCDVRSATFYDLKNCEIEFVGTSIFNLAYVGCENLVVSHVGQRPYIHNCSFIRFKDLDVFPVPGFKETLRLSINNENFDMSHWHTLCGTSHCLAGWAINLHVQGAGLESRFDPELAATLIMGACGLRSDMFFKNEEEVLAWLHS